MTSLTKEVTRKTRASVPHGVKSEIVVTMYPGGTLGLRESGRRKKTEVYFDIGTLYVRGVQYKIAAIRLTKARKKSAEKKLRRRLK
jgi:hypothetical protein